MISFGRTIGWQSRGSSRNAALNSTIAERLDRYVSSVSQPGRVLTPRERLDSRTRIEAAIGRD